MADTLDVPGFPPLRWEHYFWVGDLVLPSWAGFEVLHGRYAPKRGAKAKPVKAKKAEPVRLSINPENDDERTPPTQGQVQAFQHLLTNETAVTAAVLNRMFKHYPEDKYSYEEFHEDEGLKLPSIKKPEGLRTLIHLSGVHLLNVYKDGVAYIGFEFGCAWDGEHGAGVMTHLGRIVTSGQADCSFLDWIARRDAEGR